MYEDFKCCCITKISHRKGIKYVRYHRGSNYINSDTSINSFLLLLIPILSAVTSYLSVKCSMQGTVKTNDNQVQESMQKNMALISPLMSGFIAFTVPAGLGLYWIIGNVYQVAQQMLMNQFVIKSKSETEDKRQKERIRANADTPEL